MSGEGWDEATLRAMAATLRHRGPDDGGIWFDRTACVGLAHRRLSIVDLSAGGHQPMASADGRYVIAYNGEIYNHRQLRKELEQAGAAPTWRGHSDTETLLACFAAWGVNVALQKSVGMFALALWDNRDRALTLGRDRLGEKPLYYGWAGRTFLFGSELKALRAHPAFSGEIDGQSIAAFMRYSYVPAPRAIYRGIHKLLPGTTLTVSGNQSSAKPVPYWSLFDMARRQMERPFVGSSDDALHTLEKRLSEAVAFQQIADVPVGALLSGGVDSSTIVALMQAQSARPVHTFTIGFDSPAYNEAIYAKAVARHLGTDHTELYVTPTEARAAIPRLPTMFDEPFADSSQIPTFLVSQLARRQVTVSLSGDAGDELFGGYNRYALVGKLLKYPVSVRRVFARALTSVSPEKWNCIYGAVQKMLPASLRIGAAGDKAYKLASVLGGDTDIGIYERLVSTWQDPGAVVIGEPENDNLAAVWETLADFTDLEHRMMALDASTYLPDDILCKVDRAAMAVSLETRVPFLDHRVVEFAWSLPLSLKLGNDHRTGKWIVRQLLQKYVPVELIDRPKMGFGVPIDAWLRGPLREWAESLLGEARLRQEGFFQHEPIRRIWEEHLSGKRNWQYRLWNVLMFQSWFAAQESVGDEGQCGYLGGQSSVRN